MNLKNIWKTPRYLPYTQAMLTDDVLRNAEKSLGCKLPAAYIELLKIQNGGYINYGLPDIEHTRIYGIGESFPTILDDNWGEVKSEEIVSFELKGLIPFDGDGYYFLCFDYRKNSMPQITYVDVDADTFEIIAETFDEYLGLLEIETDENLIENSLTIQENTIKISEILNIKFEEPDYWHSGYPIYKSSYKDNWLWVSPNKVPSGFIREGDERYDELKSQMEHISLRFPEVSENATFINVYDMTILQKLSAHGFRTKSLKQILREKPIG